MPRQRRSAAQGATRSAPYQKSQSQRQNAKISRMTLKGATELGEVVKELEKSFSVAANPTAAFAMKKYVRNKFDYFGIKSPERGNIFKEVFSKSKEYSTSDVLSTVQLLWLKDQREFQYCGVTLMTTHKVALAADAEISRQTTEVLKKLLTEKSWWDTVDLLASHVAGQLNRSQPDQLGPVMDDWIQSDNMWLRRTAIIYQLSYKNNTDQEKLFRYCLKCCDEKEFFIQKAIGWALREYYKTKPKAVTQFVLKHKDELAPLSVREAMKHAKKTGDAYI